MAMQARCERLHVHRAARVLVTSRYSAERAREFYGLPELPAIVPELIDLAEWRRLLARTSRRTPTAFHRAVRGPVLSPQARRRAAARRRDRCGQRIPGLELRIVGNGPCAADLAPLARELQLEER